MREWVDTSHGAEIVAEFGADSADLCVAGADRIFVFPRTKVLDGLDEFGLLVAYDSPAPMRDAEPGPHVDSFVISFDLADYLGNLGIEPHEEALNHLVVEFRRSDGCRWDTQAAAQVRPIAERGVLVLDHDLCRSDGDSLFFCWKISGGKRTHEAERLRFDLPYVLTAEEANSRVRGLQATMIKGMQPQKVVTFVADLCGSSDRTVSGRPPLDLLTFRNIWMNSDTGSFLGLKLVGDLVLIVSDPDSFRRKGGRDILDLFVQAQTVGFPIRGGFHIGEATATDAATDNWVADRKGKEFLGDAVNRGSKMGDYKENAGGLIASGDFVEWLGGPKHDAYEFWHGAAFGTWKTDLFRIRVPGFRELLDPPVTEATPDTVRPFPDWLVDRAKELDSRLIVGLDPDLTKFPPCLRRRYEHSPTTNNLAKILVEFNRVVIDATKDVAVAFKPQSAFYEQYGMAGMQALEDTIRLVREREIPVILDAKRNDIGHTAEAYARGWLASRHPDLGQPSGWRVDAITVNGYLGSDGVIPFLEAHPAGGIFVLAKTSNPSSAELQDRIVTPGGRPLYECVGKLAAQWGAEQVGRSGYSRVGLVVGALYPEAAEALRRLVPAALFLMPGVGAQGGSVQAVVRASGKDGLGAYAASSRSVLYSFRPEDAEGDDTWSGAVREAARREARNLRDALSRGISDRRH